MNGLTDWTTYYFTVTAKNSAGEGPESNEAYATPTPPPPSLNPTIISTISVGSNPQDIAITPDGGYAYVTNYNDGSVSVISTANAISDTPPFVIRTVSLDGDLSPDYVAINPSGTQAWVTGSSGSDQVGVISTANVLSDTPPYVIDTISGLENTGGTGATGIAFTSDGTKAFVEDGGGGGANGDVYVIDTATATLASGPNPIGVGISPTDIAISGGYAYDVDSCGSYCSQSYGGTLSVIDTSSQTVANSIGLPAYYNDGVAITPNGKYAFVTTSSGGISVVSTQSNPPSLFDSVGVSGNPVGIAITQDGAYAYVTNSKDNSVSVISTANVINDNPPFVVNTISGFDNPTHILINGDYAYIVNTGDNNIVVMGNLG